MSGVGITYLWVSKEFPPFVRLEGKRGDYEVYTPERTCRIEHVKGGAMYDVWRCSACGYEYAESVSETSIVQNYCPNCGSRVVGE